MCRIQKERFEDRPEAFEQAKGCFIIDSDLMSTLRKDAVVLHPMPRVDEVRSSHMCANCNPDRTDRFIPSSTELPMNCKMA